jgi:uncharacterized protein DUF1259
MLFRRLIVFVTFVVVSSVAASTRTFAQTPPDYQAVLTTLGRTGDFKDGVLKVNIPRCDLKVVIGQRAAPTPFGFGGWVALTKGTAGTDVMMGDLVLTEDEVNPVMSALLQNGLDVTALHNHFFWEHEPEVTPVLKALRANGLNVVAIHHHMTDVKPIARA